MRNSTPSPAPSPATSLFPIKACDALWLRPPVERIIILLAAAMIPVILVALGVQLAASTGLRLEKDVWLASVLTLTLLLAVV